MVINRDVLDLIDFIVVQGTGMESLALQTTGGIRVFQIFKKPQILFGNVVRTIESTETGFFFFFFRALGSILTVKAEMNFWLRNEASPEGCYSARFEFLTHFLSYLKLLYVA